jgi:serine/threonine-protein kinase
VQPGALRGTSDLEAYDLYLRALFQFQKRGTEELREAASLFRRATQRDPQFARAWAGLASVLSVLPSWTGAPYDSVVAPARDAARRAISLDSTLAEPEAALGVLDHLGWNFAASEAAFRRAIAKDPRSATSLQWYGELLCFMGRLDEAIDVLRRAHDADPLYPTPLLTYAYALGLARRYDEAIPEAERAVALDPRNAIARGVLAVSLSGKGRHDEAVREGEMAYKLVPAAYLAGELAGLYSRAGQRDTAVAIVKNLERVAKSPSVAYALAMAYGGLADTGATLSWLERATATRGSITSGSMMEPAFDPVRGSARFRIVVTHLGLDPERLGRTPTTK